MFIKKRYIIITLTLVVLLLIPTVVSAAESYIKTIDVHVNTVNVAVNNKLVSVDNFLYEGTTYIPLRAVSEALGADVGWDEETSTASIDLYSSSIDTSAMITNIRFLHGYKFLESLCDEITELRYYIEIILYNNVNPFSTEHTALLLNDIEELLINKYKIYNDNLYIIKTDFITDNNDALKAWETAMENAFYFTATAINFLGLQAEAENINSWELYYSIRDSVYDCIENIENFFIIANYIANQNYNAYRKTSHVANILERAHYRSQELDNELYIDTIDQVNSWDKLNYATVSIYKPKFNNTTPNTNIIEIVPIKTEIEYVPIIIQTPKPIFSIENNNLYSFPLHLYSNDGKVYLGKCVTDEKDKEGIYYWSFGDYSSDYSQTSIWNKVGKYGSSVNNESAFNSIATKPPKIVDNNGTFVAYLSINERIEPRWTMEQLRQLLVNNNQ